MAPTNPPATAINLTLQQISDIIRNEHDALRTLAGGEGNIYIYFDPEVLQAPGFTVQAARAVLSPERWIEVHAGTRFYATPTSADPAGYTSRLYTLGVMHAVYGPSTEPRMLITQGPAEVYEKYFKKDDIYIISESGLYRSRT